MIDPFVGLKVGYHNHAQEFVADIDGINGYEYFASLLDDEVALELDLFWAATAAGKHVWSRSRSAWPGRAVARCWPRPPTLDCWSGSRPTPCSDPACRPRVGRSRNGNIGEPLSAQTTLASGELGLHVLDTMVAIDEAVTEGRTVAVDSRVDPVPLVSDDYDPFAATL